MATLKVTHKGGTFYFRYIIAGFYLMAKIDSFIQMIDWLQVPSYPWVGSTKTQQIFTNRMYCFLLIMSLAEKWGLCQGVTVLPLLLKIHQDKHNFLQMGEGLLGLQHTEFQIHPLTLLNNLKWVYFWIFSTILRLFTVFFFLQMKQLCSCGRCIMFYCIKKSVESLWKHCGWSKAVIYISDILNPFNLQLSHLSLPQ